MQTDVTVRTTLPAAAGIGLKARHYAEIIEARPSLAFVEVHAENYMGAGGPPHRWLTAIRQHYGLSVHGVGLSLGADQPLDQDHLDALARLVDRYQPELVSEHLAWAGIDGTYLNDLLPIPYTPYTLDLVCRHVDQVQEHLARQILVENPSAYIDYAETAIPEQDFLAALVHRTGCALLLDVNNLFVSARNLGLDEQAYLAGLPATAVAEYHLAGHHLHRRGNAEIRIDNHGSRVCDEVWALYRAAVARFGRHPTLIEWDTDVPELFVLLDEAARADREAADAIAA
jgi:hypothetical protein